MRDAGAIALPTGTEAVSQQHLLAAGDGLLRRAYPWPLRVVLDVPVVDFTVRTLMELQPGTILETDAPYNEDLALQVDGQVIGRAKFEVTGPMLAVRITGVA